MGNWMSFCSERQKQMMLDVPRSFLVVTVRKGFESVGRFRILRRFLFGHGCQRNNLSNAYVRATKIQSRVERIFLVIEVVDRSSCTAAGAFFRTAGAEFDRRTLSRRFSMTERDEISPEQKYVSPKCKFIFRRLPRLRPTVRIHSLYFLKLLLT